MMPTLDRCPCHDAPAIEFHGIEPLDPPHPSLARRLRAAGEVVAYVAVGVVAVALGVGIVTGAGIADAVRAVRWRLP